MSGYEVWKSSICWRNEALLGSLEYGAQTVISVGSAAAKRAGLVVRQASSARIIVGEKQRWRGGAAASGLDFMNRLACRGWLLIGLPVPGGAAVVEEVVVVDEDDNEEKDTEKEPETLV
mgnify:CR=1 FL=1